MFRLHSARGWALALLLVLLGIGPPAMADPDPFRVKYDESGKPASLVARVSFTASSDDTVDFGAEFCFGDIQKIVGADSVGIQYLAREDEDIDSGPMWQGRPDSNPRAGAPRVSWELVTVPAGESFAFCCGGGGSVRIVGRGQAGSLLLLLTARCP